MPLARAALALLPLCLGSGLLVACDSALGESRTLVWSDEFEGQAGHSPDPAKWRFEEFADATDTEKQCYTDSPDNVSLDGRGHLVIRALEQPGNCADGWWREYTSGRITTEGLHTWSHGRLEIRAKVPDGLGTWPAFWALGANKPEVEWPRSGEIDVMEYVAVTPNHLIGTLHGPTSTGERWFLQASTDTDEPLSGGFHTYAVDWSAEELVWSLDGEEYGTVTREEVETQGEWVFDKPFYLLLNLAIEGLIGGPVADDTEFPQDFVVDYVRVYQ